MLTKNLSEIMQPFTAQYRKKNLKFTDLKIINIRNWSISVNMP